MKSYMNFEDLEIWKEAMDICKEVYELFKDCKDYNFRNQICDAAVSVPSNIAEGYERKGSKETIQFLYIAKGSNGELRTQLYLAVAFDYIDKEKGAQLVRRTKRQSIMIYNYIQSLQPR